MDDLLNEFKENYDNYEIINLIGKDTWQIKLNNYNKIAILKEIKNINIYRKLKSMNIKGIPKIYDIFEKDGKTYIIEEYINGDTLQNILASQGKISPPEVMYIVIKLCDILTQVHNANIIHRDIKPSNIILTSDNAVYLIDFAIARNKNNNAVNDTKRLGTEFYASPEQYGFAQTDNRSDIYSIGKLMTVLLTGKEEIKNINKLPYYRIIKKCVKIDSANRYKNTSKLKRALIIKKYYIIPSIFLIALLVLFFMKYNVLLSKFFKKLYASYKKFYNSKIKKINLYENNALS